MGIISVLLSYTGKQMSENKGIDVTMNHRSRNVIAD
jgi:hypothetical protein